jgi:hypothetical protein
MNASREKSCRKTQTEFADGVESQSQEQGFTSRAVAPSWSSQTIGRTGSTKQQDSFQIGSMQTQLAASWRSRHRKFNQEAR